jgi:glycosyltransferase involved in cell wall biosynthesis
VKKVLYVTEILPSRTSGAGVTTLGVLRALQSVGCDVHLIVNVADAEAARAGGAEARCRTVTPVPRPRLRVTPVRAAVQCAARLGYWPRWQREVWDEVAAALRRQPFDLLFLDHLRAAEYGRLVKASGHALPVALREHNVEHELQQVLATHAGGAVRRLEQRLRERRYLAIESNLARYCDVVLPISPVDGAKLAALNPGFPVAPLPPAVDTEHYRPVEAAPRPDEIVFVGGLAYEPNADAVRWFIDEVLPRVVARRPGAHLTVVGQRPPEWLARRGAHVTPVGFVPDERPYVAQARVVVAPIRSGSGVRIKILNALAMAKPVVATVLGAQGLAVEHGRSILLADAAEDFAAAVTAVLESDRLASGLGDAARRACDEHYALARLGERLVALLPTPPGAAPLSPRAVPA